MIPLFKVFMDVGVSDNLESVLSSGYISQGSKVEEYEKEIKKWFNYEHILSLNSATSGITLALRLLNLSPGDEVLATPLTCVATNFPILANHLDIKWVDVDPRTCNMDLYDLEHKITPNTKAIVIVHWGGYPVNMDELNRIRDTYNIPIIEDCAHAFGAKYNQKYIGTHGNIAVFSTQAIKTLTTGDGGLIFLPNMELYERAKLLRWYGISRELRSSVIDFRMESDILEWGYKMHMNDINATIGISNLPWIHQLLERSREIADYYNNEIDKLNNISYIGYPSDQNCYMSSYWLYTIRVPNKSSFIQYMKKNNICTSQVHNRNDLHSCVSTYRVPLLQLDEIEKNIVCIPCGWWVSNEQCEYIIDRLKWWDINYNKEFIIRPIKDTDISYLTLLNKYMSHSQFEKRLRKMDGVIYVMIDNDNTVIAAAKLMIEKKLFDPVAHIEDVLVSEDYRSMGLGTVLVSNLVEIAKDYKCYKIILSAKESLTPFYEKCGFVNDGIAFTKRL